MAVILQFDFEWPEISERAIGRAHKKSGTAAMEWFVKNRLKLRFSGAVQNQLRWEPRAEGYEKRKQKRGTRGTHHVLSRKTARNVLGGGARIIASARAKSRNYNMRIVLQNLNPGYKRRPDPGRPNMASEIKRFTPDEIKIIGQLYVAALKSNLEIEMQGGKRRRKVR